MGSEMHTFRVIAIWNSKFWFGSPCTFLNSYIICNSRTSKYSLRNSKRGPIIHPKWPFVVFEGCSSKSTQRAKQYSNGLYKWPKKRLYHFQKVLLTDCLLLLVNAFYTLYFSYSLDDLENNFSDFWKVHCLTLFRTSATVGMLIVDTYFAAVA